MPKHKNLAITVAARMAGQHLTTHSAVDAYMRRITDNQRSEEQSGTFTGVIVRDGRITDVIASNGAVKIES